MNFYVTIGHRADAVVRELILDKPAQDDLTQLFTGLADQVLKGDHVEFDPGYRPDEGEIITIDEYAVVSTFSGLLSADGASETPAVSKSELVDGAVRAVVGVEWKGKAAQRLVFQRIDSRYVLRGEGRRLMLAGGRFVRDSRPGIEITERVDAVLEGSTLYITSWSRAHAILDLSAWVREATMTEADGFVKNKKFALAKGFAVAKVADSWVRRKIVSITDNGILNRTTPQVLRKYAAKFDLDVQLENGKILLPAEKKEFKRVLNLLDEDLLSFEPTDERWVVNSKRKASK